MTTPKPAPDRSAEVSARGQDAPAQQPPAAPKGIGPMVGAIFLMATSAIGPGFLTQTANFTIEMGAAFACAIALSIVVDIAIQLNVWRVLGVTGLRANELANKLLPGLGWVLAGLVALGGLVFNIGNVGGTGLGLNIMFGLDPRVGAAISTAIAVLVFLSKRAGVALDRIVAVLGAVMIGLMIYVAFSSNPPVGEALKQTVAPDKFSVIALTTITGGTVGGYITFAGVHRLIDAGHTGPENADYLSKSSVSGVIVTGIMRILLFLAVLGVVAGGAVLSKDNPGPDVFYQAAGEFGRRAYGLVLWAAGLSSVVGASFTSVSFLTKQGFDEKKRGWITVGFILVSAAIFLVLQKTPQSLLIFAGAFNGIILPIGFGIVLWAAIFRKDLLKGYKHPVWLTVFGVIVFAGTVYMGVASLTKLSQLWA